MKYSILDIKLNSFIVSQEKAGLPSILVTLNLAYSTLIVNICDIGHGIWRGYRMVLVYPLILLEN